MKVIDKLRQLILGITVRGGQIEQARDMRRMVLGTAKLARRPGALSEALKGLAEAEAFHAAETSTWLDTTAIINGASGPFDACDLTAWLAIAKKAGVAIVPAVEILRLTEDEAEAASGLVAIPTGAIPDAARARARAALEADGFEIEAPAPQVPIDMEALTERLFAAMDEIPEGWMVRSARCGGSELKALAGTGHASEGAPEVKFGPDLEVGPGWVRNGNRRRVNTQDRRTIELHAGGPHRGMTFLARPWIIASRHVVCDDPHRHGSPFEGPGRWPMEWRAFVHRGQVVGCSIYYGWTGEITPANAAMAIQIRELAQRMVDTAIAQGLVPRLMEVEHARRNQEAAELLEREGFGRDDFACCLDFIETAEGPLLLEGGPGNTPFGGAHPCSFAGSGGPPILGSRAITEGVAFRPMSHVLIGEPKTWTDGDRTGAILTWEETEALAAAQF